MSHETVNHEKMTLVEYANEFALLVGGRVTVLGQNYAEIVRPVGPPLYLLGPNAGRSWRETNRRIINATRRRLVKT